VLYTVNLTGRASSTERVEQGVCAIRGRLLELPEINVLTVVVLRMGARWYKEAECWKYVMDILAIR
jgi:hypothetical protein